MAKTGFPKPIGGSSEQNQTPQLFVVIHSNIIGRYSPANPDPDYAPMTPIPNSLLTSTKILLSGATAETAVGTSTALIYKPAKPSQSPRKTPCPALIIQIFGGMLWPGRGRTIKGLPLPGR
ncbi:MAG: hypothetical protein WAM60_08385 [Candidatus Promineifilaceae bacterium]